MLVGMITAPLPVCPRPDCLRVSAGLGAARADHLLRRLRGAAAVTWCNSVWLDVPHLTLHDIKQRANLQLGSTRRKKQYRIFFHINVPPHSHRMSKLDGSYLSVDKRLLSHFVAG